VSITLLPSQTPVNPYILINDSQGGPEIRVPITIDSRGYYNMQGLSLDPINLPQGEIKLATVDNVNVNTATEQVLFLVPVPYTLCIITRITIYNASVSLTTWSGGFGWNAGTDTDTVASATHTELTTAAKYTHLSPIAGSAKGGAGGQFATKATIVQGAPATISVYVWGWMK